MFWGCSGGALGAFAGCSGGILGESPQNTFRTAPEHSQNTLGTPSEHHQETPRTPPDQTPSCFPGGTHRGKAAWGYTSGGLQLTRSKQALPDPAKTSAVRQLSSSAAAPPQQRKFSSHQPPTTDLGARQMCIPKELVPDVLPRGDNLGVDLGVFWGCSGGVPGVISGCSGKFWGYSGGIPPEYI